MTQTPPSDVHTRSQAHLWLPFTQMKDYDTAPLVITHGEGVKLYDTTGRAYYDAFSSVWLNVHGHRKHALDQAIVQQLSKVAHTTSLGMTHDVAVHLAAKLVSLAPSGLTRVFYSDSGATSVEVALKMAFQYWQNVGRPEKNTFVTMEGNYHGDTLGAVSVGNIERFHALYRPLLFPCLRVPFPDAYRHPSGDPHVCAADCIATIENTFVQHGYQIAALIVEPLVQGASGMRLMPPGFLRDVARLCKQYEVLLICDEVATGFGRTGTLFACEQEGISPDLMTVAKGLTGGYLPVAATLTTSRIYDAFYDDYDAGKTLFHGHSYTGNPLGCAVALANLRLFEEENILAHVQSSAQVVHETLATWHPIAAIGDIRQRGLMVGIELVENRNTKKPYPSARRMGYHATQRMRELGLLTRPLGDTIVFMPPLASTHDELCEMLHIIRQAIEDVTQPPYSSFVANKA